MPVTSFAPEFLEFYRQAAQEPKTIYLKSERAAISLRARLHSLRNAMRKEEHPLTTIANSVTISVPRTPDTEGRWLLIGNPCDKSYLPALADAGITVDTLPNIEPELELPPTAGGDRPIDPQAEAMKKIFSGEKKP